MALHRIMLILLAAALAPRAEAITLYKSIAPNGVVQFSDTPPEGAATIIEQRDLDAPRRAGIETAPTRVAPVESLVTDDMVARATEQVDLAEHALALARRGVWAPMEGLRLRGPRRTASDEERIERYKHDVLLARQALLEVLNRRLTTVASR